MASDNEPELSSPPSATVNPFTIANGQVERASSPQASLHLPHKTRFRKERRPPIPQLQAQQPPLKKQKLLNRFKTITEEDKLAAKDRLFALWKKEYRSNTGTIERAIPTADISNIYL